MSPRDRGEVRLHRSLRQRGHGPRGPGADAPVRGLEAASDALSVLRSGLAVQSDGDRLKRLPAQPRHGVLQQRRHGVHVRRGAAAHVPQRAQGPDAGRLALRAEDLGDGGRRGLADRRQGAGGGLLRLACAAV
eukprot:SRR837773.7985.p4 GENE.SRR837773.7985~~SRR837773.7985.p4  ORF type:complete len:133 (-),score=22.74 SRR837773.7985:473-871(-)